MAESVKVTEESVKPKAVASESDVEVNLELASRIESFLDEEIFQIQAMGFSSSMVHEGVIDSFSVAVKAVMEDAQKKFSKKYKSEDVAKVIEKLTSTYISASVGLSNEMKKIVDQHLAFPPDYLPPSHAENVTTYSAEFEEELDEKIANAENRFKANCVMSKILKKEVKKSQDIDTVPIEMKELSKLCSEMVNVVDEKMASINKMREILDEKVLQLNDEREEDSAESDSDSFSDDF